MTKSELRKRLVEIRERTDDPELKDFITKLIAMIDKQLESGRYE